MTLVMAQELGFTLSLQQVPCDEFDAFPIVKDEIEQYRSEGKEAPPQHPEQGKHGKPHTSTQTQPGR